MCKHLFFLVFCSLFSIAQEYSFKLGKVSLDELKMEKCSFYEEANSMILAEKGVLTFELDPEHGWRFKLKVNVRKKVFNITDTDVGDISILLYTPENNKSSHDKIGAFKAFSHNIENGKIVSEKINRKDGFIRRINRYGSQLSFAVPNVREGTIVEYQYELYSYRLNNLSTWNFQYVDVPVGYSEFSYTIPEWFNYQINQLGNQVQVDWKNEKTQETFRIHSKSRSTEGRGFGSTTRTNFSTSEFDSSSKRYKGIARNISPILEEPFATNISDIPARVEFQLVSIDYPNQPSETIAGDYASFNKELLDSYSFGKRLDNGGFIKEFEETLEGLDKLEQASTIFKLLQQKLSWDKVYSIFSDDSGRPTFKKGEGNVADINLTLIAALRALKINAYPVILSTRGHGTIHPIYPNYDEFNYLIAYVMLDGKGYFMDVASSMPFGELPQKCRNGKGWIVDSEKSGWVDLKQGANHEVLTMIDFKVTPETQEIKVSQRKKNYAAYDEIDEVNEKTHEELVEDVEDEFDDLELVELTYNGDNSYEKPFTKSLELKKENGGEDILYISPIPMGLMNENPFNREVRDAPIDFPYKINQRVVVNLIFPEGYTAELPSSAIFKLADNEIIFSYISKQQQNRVTINGELKVNKTYYTREEYENLRHFFQEAVSKVNELVVLKKL